MDKQFIKQEIKEINYREITDNDYDLIFKGLDENLGLSGLFLISYIKNAINKMKIGSHMEQQGPNGDYVSITNEEYFSYTLETLEGLNKVPGINIPHTLEITYTCDIVVENFYKAPN